MAGLTLALQLRRQSPELRLALIEKSAGPAPDAIHKVGESTVELASRYFRTTLGLQGILEAEHLPKCGLRFFFRHEDNEDIAKRVELGHFRWPLQPSDQIDRGRFENRIFALLEEDDGVALFRTWEWKDVMLNASGHLLDLQRDEEVMQLEARWVLDATGRRAFLKRKLGLDKDIKHDHCAAWFRVDAAIQIDDWSACPGWNWPFRMRYLATNHLMGRGYWVWLIPLSSGATSVGISFDPNIHPFASLSTERAAIAWLEAHEPQCAQAIAAHQRLDFRVMRHFPRNAKALSGAPRWALTGESGYFADPFYSSGADLIAIANTLVADLIIRDFRGEGIEVRRDSYNRLFAQIFEAFHDLYRRQSEVWGHAQAMIAKIVWDFALYWAVMCPPFFQERLTDLSMLQKTRPIFSQMVALNKLMQRLFWRWSSLPQKEPQRLRVDYGKIQILQGLLYQLTETLPPEAWLARLQEHGQLLSTMASHLHQKALERNSLLERYPALRPDRATRPFPGVIRPSWVPRYLGASRSVEEDLDEIWLH